jgi:hypothetical protein
VRADRVVRDRINPARGDGLVVVVVEAPTGSAALASVATPTPARTDR